jgi:H+/gluconate symporter-like permease
MSTYYLSIALTYIVIAFAVALLFVFLFRRRILGHFWGALIVALLGAFIGGVVDYLFHDIIEALRNLNGAVNIFPPLIASVILIRLFAHFSERSDEE